MTARIIHAPYTIEEQASPVACNGSVPMNVCCSNRSKSSNGSKRFERLEQLGRFERNSEGLLLDLQ
jgi:hypothetical protein